MRTKDFIWHDDTVTHIQKEHGVEPEEVEEVFTQRYLLIKAKYGRYNAMGYTINGRLLSVVFEYKGKGNIEIVTARDMSKKERKYFKKRWGGEV